MLDEIFEINVKVKREKENLFEIDLFWSFHWWLTSYLPKIKLKSKSYARVFCIRWMKSYARKLNVKEQWKQRAISYFIFLIILKLSLFYYFLRHVQCKGAKLDLRILRGKVSANNSSAGPSPFCRFVNIQLSGLQPQGVKGQRGTILLENPRGDYQLGSDELKKQVCFVLFTWRSAEFRFFVRYFSKYSIAMILHWLKISWISLESYIINLLHDSI